MTGRERLLAVVAGNAVDRQPVVCICCDCECSDLVLRSFGAEPNGRAEFVSIDSPFKRAIDSGVDLNALIAENPEAGNAKLDEFVNATRAAIDGAANVDGIVYHLHGAEPEFNTPMQYGGLYLERDRELLESLPSSQISLLIIHGKQEPYLDFVSDLTATFFGWSLSEAWPVSAVRELRSGLLATSSSEADIFLVQNAEEKQQFMNSNRVPCEVTNR